MENKNAILARVRDLSSWDGATSGAWITMETSEPATGDDTSGDYRRRWIETAEELLAFVGKSGRIRRPDGRACEASQYTIRRARFDLALLRKKGGQG